MMKKYSNTKATLAIAKASFKSILRSPSAVVFSLLFPLIFIVVFGFIGSGGLTVDLGIGKNNDVNSPIYRALENIKMIHLVEKSEKDMNQDLEKGRLDAILNIQKNPAGMPAYFVNVQYTEASKEKGNVLKSILSNVILTMNSKANPGPPPVAELKESTIKGREYKTIDFILPGQLGFALLSTGVFGTAFVFISLRLTLVIKRFFATPVSKASIVLGEAIARIVFALFTAIFIIMVGHFAFGFTLIHGFTTVLNMLVLSTIGLIVFLGFGLAVSGIAKNESTVPPIANIFTLPQFLLSGTFFSISAFPAWLQPISRALPLTYLNDALRKIAFEGASLWDVNHQILILLLWGVGIYALAVKVFKWE
ncbi:MAG: ABC transporter permease [Bacteroidetes bacterium]|nr:ABC transporter permease [Bacteroidota bacterium]MBU1373623.1 ABC transporter permease [Bacteroidota bacterium]MBU1485949.1 ABC transporter permease [Bacteroidota bacterium]MBU1760659.1 ABC transporter permease [Bacteroidota bacterium]MBU2046217.1 ABC transporter permease [Bacteroidota bacterium]